MFLGCVLKDLFVLSLHCCVLPQGFPCSLTKLFTLCSYGKTFSDFSFLVFLNIQLSVSFLFLYSVFNERLLSRNSRSVVGPSGLEPPTSCLSGTRSNLLSYEPVSYGTAFTRFGGDDGIRTHDPLLAGQVLSQLSYTPIYYTGYRSVFRFAFFCFSMSSSRICSLKIEQQLLRTSLPLSHVLL